MIEFLIVIAARLVWQVYCDVPTAFLFWSLCLGFELYDGHTAPFLLVGLAMNALVVLANDGYMPVIGGRGKATSVWKPAQATDRLLFLADRFPLRLWIFTLILSIGDFFILISIVAQSFGWKL